MIGGVYHRMFKNNSMLTPYPTLNRSSGEVFLKHPFERFLNIRSATSGSLGRDGRRLAMLTDITGTHQLWTVDDPQSWPEQLTFFEDRLMFAGEADPNKIALFGRSYGGFMVLSSMVTYPDLWAAGIDIVGIASFVTFLENTSEYRRHLRESEYGSLEQDREFLESISPLTHLEKIDAPLMVIHGKNDPRVPVSEAEQVAHAVESWGLKVELLIYDDEGHGLAKRANRLDAYHRVVQFLMRHLGPESNT